MPQIDRCSQTGQFSCRARIHRLRTIGQNCGMAPGMLTKIEERLVVGRFQVYGAKNLWLIETVL